MPLPKWELGKQCGVPTQSTCVGYDTSGNMLADTEKRQLQTIATEQGPIRLPYGDMGEVGYMPSTDALRMIPYADTRRTGFSDRYYK